MTHALYLDRTSDTTQGVLTLQRVASDKVIKVFERLPVASGQNGYDDPNWENRKSPTPFGSYWLRTKSVPLQMTPRGTPFFPIGSDRKNIRVIKGPGGKIRTEVGLHLENEFPGTWGCTALLHDTEQRAREAWALMHYLESLWPNEQYIPYIVI